MTQDEALTRAQEAWGKDVPANGELAKKFGYVMDDGTAFGKRRKVGVWHRDTANAGHFEAYGESGTWEGAFDDSKRRNPETRR